MHPDVRHIGSISRAHEYTSKRPTVLCEDHSARGILVEPASNVHLRCTTNEGLLQRSQSISIISHHHHHHHVVVSNALALARTHRQQIEDGARAVLANVRARVSRRLVQQERHTTHQVRIDIRRRARSGRGSRWRSRPRTWCRGTAAALLVRGCSTVDTSATALVVARPACSGRRHSDEAP